MISRWVKTIFVFFCACQAFATGAEERIHEQRIEISFDNMTLKESLLCLYGPMVKIYVEDKLLGNSQKITINSPSSTRKEVLMKLMKHFKTISLSSKNTIIIIDSADDSSVKRLVLIQSLTEDTNQTKIGESKSSVGKQNKNDTTAAPDSLLIKRLSKHGIDVHLQGHLALRRLDTTIDDVKYEGWYWTVCFKPKERWTVRIIDLKFMLNGAILTPISFGFGNLFSQEFIIKPFEATDPSAYEFAQNLKIASYTLK